MTADPIMTTVRTTSSSASSPASSGQWSENSVAGLAFAFQKAWLDPMKAWIAGGLLDAATISDFDDLISGKKPKLETDRRRLFVSTGSALFDNLTLEYLLQQITPSRR